YVNIDAFHPRMISEETEMNLTFPNVKQFYIMKSNDNGSSKREIGKFAAPIITKLIKQARTITVDPGTSVRKIIKSLSEGSFNHCQEKIIVPIMGGLGNEKMGLHANQLVEKLGDILHCHYYFLNCPATISNTKIRDALIKEVNIQQVIEVWDQLDLAIMGMGNLQEGCTAFSIFSDSMIKQVKNSKAVSEIAVNFFDEEGNYLDILDDYRISIPFKKLKNAETKIAIAFGIEKAQAIIAAIKANVIDLLVTDSITVNKIKTML
ncbi:MAG TPA: sugar-binding domain-containing protein, partial [Atribacterota bacterium]|nr:sugar-binding domain-containing protein [Atribacterota bacterium]